MERLAMWLALSWLLGCNDPDPDPDPEVEAATCPTAPPVDFCAGLTCLDVCGRPFALGQPPTLAGWDIAGMTGGHAEDVVQIGATLVAVDGHSVRTYGADRTPIGLLGPLDDAHILTAAGGRVLTQIKSGPLVILSVDDPAHPIAEAVWHPLSITGLPSVTPRGTWQGMALIGLDQPRSTVAVVDFTDPTAPVVEACLHDPETARLTNATATDRWVVASSPLGGVMLFDPTSADTPAARVPGREPFGVDGDRLMVWVADDEAVLYDISQDVPVEVARRSGAHARVDGNAGVAGGVMLYSPSTPNFGWGLDLRDDTLRVVRSHRVDGGECTVQIRDEDDVVRLFDVAPIWGPTERYALDSAPACPIGGLPLPASSYSSGPSADGTEILVRGMFTGWNRFRPSDGAVIAAPLTDATWYPEWIDGAFLYPGFPCTNSLNLHVQPENGGSAVELDLPGYPWSIVPDGPIALVVTASSFPGCNGASSGSEDPTRHGFVVDAFGQAEPFALPSDQTRALLPFGDDLAAVVEDGNHLLVSRDGEVEADLPGARLGERSRYSASSLGLFTDDDLERVWWSRPDLEPTLLAAECTGTRLVAAEGPYVRWLRTVRPARWFDGFVVTELVEPSTGAVVASLPTAAGGRRVFGQPGAIASQNVILVNDP